MRQVAMRVSWLRDPVRGSLKTCLSPVLHPFALSDSSVANVALAVFGFSQNNLGILQKASLLRKLFCLPLDAVFFSQPRNAECLSSCIPIEYLSYS